MAAAHIAARTSPSRGRSEGPLRPRCRAGMCNLPTKAFFHFWRFASSPSPLSALLGGEGSAVGVLAQAVGVLVQAVGKKLWVKIRPHNCATKLPYPYIWRLQNPMGTLPVLCRHLADFAGTGLRLAPQGGSALDSRKLRCGRYARTP